MTQPRDLTDLVPADVQTELAAAVAALELHGPAVTNALRKLDQATTAAWNAVNPVDPTEDEWRLVDVLPGPSGLHAADRGARRPGRPELAESLAVLVRRSSREHGGVPAKWLGDGVMFHFREPGGGGALAALRMAEELPAAGLPPAHVGVAAGPVVAQGGDYFGRTVNLAARIAAYASASRVLVSEPVVQRPLTQGVTFVELGLVQLEGIAHPVRLLKARRA